LSVVRAGRPGELSLRAGPGHVADASAAFEAELEATLGAADLLQQAPQLSWLAPHLSGQSRWQVGVQVPRVARAGQAAGAARLQLRSSLQGMALDLPEPLHKPAGESLATTVETSLPLDGGEIRVDLGGRLALRARSGD